MKLRNLSEPLLLIIAAGLFTSVVILLSQAKGRLLFFPTFDAIGHMSDAITRLETWKAEGAWGITKQYLRNPAHAPWSSFLSAFSFGLVGIKDWAPAAANFFLIFLYLKLVALTLRSTGLVTLAFGSLWFLSLPLAVLAVQEIQADWASSFFLTWFCLRIGRPGFLSRFHSKNLFSGMLLGFALLAKPTVFPVTLALGGFALTASLAVEAFHLRKPFQLWKRLLPLTLGVGLVSLPHAVVAMGRDWNYIFENSFGIKKQVWVLNASSKVHWNYYFTGEGANRLLGWQEFPLLFSLLLLTYFVFTSRSPYHRLKHLVALAVLGVALLLPTLNPNKQPAFALFFYTYLFFSILETARPLLLTRVFKAHNRLRPHFIFGVFLVYSFASLEWPLIWGTPNQDHVARRTEIVRETLAELISAQPLPRSKPLSVMVVGTGDINSPLLHYLSRKYHQNFYFFTPDDSSTLNAYRQFSKEADLVLLGEKQSPIVANFLLAYRHLDSLQQQFLREDWEVRKRFAYLHDQPGYVLLQRKRDTTSSALP